MAETVHLWDTRERAVREFEPIEPGKVRLYVCGISVSGPPHVGHGRSYVIFDVLRRMLEHAGYRVRHVQNFTDIEEPIVRRATEQGIEPAEYARKMEEAYFEAMDQLGVLHAHHFPKVTDHIDRIIEATEQLQDHECAYPIDDGIAFRVCDIADFGGLFGRDPAEAIVHEVPEEAWNGRENPFDFILWRNKDDVGVTFETPWGTGRPGWHTECAVLATDLLGDAVDIHGGGMDLVFPHHECERAIARCLTGTSFSKHWIHNGLVTLADEKMSKSLRNIVSLSDAIAEHGPAVVRMAYLTAPYRETVEWTDTLLDDAREGVEGLVKALAEAERGSPTEPVAACLDAFVLALRDDLDVPGALEHLETLAQGHASEPGAHEAMAEALDLLGLANLDPFRDHLPTEA